MNPREQDGRRSAPGLRTRAYARARRHSRFVRFLRWAIPSGAALSIAGVTAWAMVDPLGRLAGVSLGPVKVSGTQVTMENPKLSGYRSRSGTYEVTATTATQDLRNPARVELNDLRGRLNTDQNGGTARLEAAFGVLDTAKERLDLRENVRVRSSKGQEAQLKSASIDLKSGAVVSNEPVTVTLENATVAADSVEVTDGGRVISFKGRVRSVFIDAGPGLSAGPGLGVTPSAADAAPGPMTQTSQAQPKPNP
jgi:lipopolysaccharide export system protein LptC